MNLLTGEYNNAIDEKGRLSFPSKLRTAINQNVVIVTRGLNGCLWLFTSDEWEIFQTKVMSNASMLNDRNLLVVRRLIAPAQEVEFDKNGRLSIPQSLRDVAGLKKECTVLGMAKYVEIWDSVSYKEYLAASEDDFTTAAKEFNNISF